MNKIYLLSFLIFFAFPTIKGLAANTDILEGQPAYYGTSTEALNKDPNKVTYDITDNNPLTKFASNKSTYMYIEFKESVPQYTIKEINGIISGLSTSSSVSLLTTTGKVIALGSPQTIPKFFVFTEDTPIKGLYFINNTASRYEVADYKLMAVSVDDYPPIDNLIETHNENSVSLSWDNPKVDNFVGVTLEQNGVRLLDLSKNVNSYQIGGLKPSTDYSFKLTSNFDDNYKSTSKSITVRTDDIPIDDTPPSEVSELQTEVTESTVKLSYSLPNDEDYYHTKIYRNNNLITTLTNETEFLDKGLKQDTVYVYKVVTYDKSLNYSSGVTVTVKTLLIKDDVPPPAVNSLQVKALNGGGRASWNNIKVSDLEGYDIYLDGTKHNERLIGTNSYQFEGLNNDQSYNVYVIAVDKSGNKSEKSNSINFRPSLNSVPPINIGDGSSNGSGGYKLKDIADSVSSWFGSIWLILAFSIAIVLAFIIAHRVRNLFLG